MIKPTIGRVVWFRSPRRIPNFATLDLAEPFIALIAYVHSDTMVNLTVSDHFGRTRAFEDVPLWQGEGEPPSDLYCEWMPFQRGQAMKTEALEAKLAATG